MDDESESNIFTKWSKDVEKSFKNMQKDFKQFFRIEDKGNNGESKTSISRKEFEQVDTVKTNEKSEINIADKKNKAELVVVPEKKTAIEDWNKQFNNGLEKMKADANKNLQAMKDQWNNIAQNFDQNNQKIAQKFNENNQKIKQFFETQQHSMDTTLKKIEDQMKQKKIENHEQFLKFVSHSSKNWNNFMIDQQKKFEQNVSVVNKAGWNTSLRIILVAIPLIVILALVFSLIRDFI